MNTAAIFFFNEPLSDDSKRIITEMVTEYEAEAALLKQELAATDHTLLSTIDSLVAANEQIKDAEAAMDQLDEELAERDEYVQDLIDALFRSATRADRAEEQAKTALASAAPTERRKAHLEKTLQQIQQIMTQALINQPTGISRVTARHIATLAGASLRSGSQNSDDKEAGSC